MADDNRDSIVSDFLTFLTERNLEVLWRTSLGPMESESFEYGNELVRVQFDRDHGVWTLLMFSIHSGNRFGGPVYLLRAVLDKSRDVTDEGVASDIQFVKSNWARIVEALAPENVLSTELQLKRLHEARLRNHMTVLNEYGNVTG